LERRGGSAEPKFCGELGGCFGGRELQRLKPVSLCGGYVAAEAATHKDIWILKRIESEERFLAALGMTTCWLSRHDDWSGEVVAQSRNSAATWADVPEEGNFSG
jgi:hypothetical protein